jgi:hypothetical protein
MATPGAVKTPASDTRRGLREAFPDNLTLIQYNQRDRRHFIGAIVFVSNFRQMLITSFAQLFVP